MWRCLCFQSVLSVDAAMPRSSHIVFHGYLVSGTERGSEVEVFKHRVPGSEVDVEVVLSEPIVFLEW